MKSKYLLSASAAGICALLLVPTPAAAQSTGSTEFEVNTITVTGTRQKAIGGVKVPDTPKAKEELDAEIIGRQRPGQTVNDIVNLVPGVSFQNNDATGAAGGTFTIRGFDSTRISQTVDGIPLNDTGNYAIYSNQQPDPETLSSVNVNLGSTDIDSPTASASGGTVNINTRIPDNDFGLLLSGMAGGYLADGAPGELLYRVFGMVDTGDFTGMGTKAWFSASYTHAPVPFNNYGHLRKQQYNGRIYQELGSSGDFISVSGNWNANRNNFFGSVPLRTDLTVTPNGTGGNPPMTRIPGDQSNNRFPLTGPERFYDINYPCTLDTPQAGTADSPAAGPAAPTAGGSCGTEFDRRYNPSNTGNIRGESRFTLTDGLVLTVDPSFQYVKANGGGTITGNEYPCKYASGKCQPNSYTGPYTAFLGYIGNGYYFGDDLNGDGDTLDGVTLIAPSETTTNRYGVIASLTYKFDPDNTVRVTYTYDRGRHRQTGEAGYLMTDGEPYEVFPIDDPVPLSDGTLMQKRDRLSYATLNQFSGEYTGKFFDEKLIVLLGVRAPFFKRDLNQNCFTTSASGFVDCVAPDQVSAYATAHPYSYNTSTDTVSGYATPQSRTYKYDKLLPNVGFTYMLSNQATLFFNYSKGLSVPGTDILYNAFYFPVSTSEAQPKPETTDSFDFGARYQQGNISAQLSGWYTKYKNRIASAYDPELDLVITRNLGEVNKWGIDGSLAYKPTPNLLFYVWGSYLNSEIKDDLLAGYFDTDHDSSTPEVPVYYATGGKRESGAPVYTFGARVQGTIGPVDIGVQFKRTGQRYVNDENLPIYQCFNAAGALSGSVQRGLFCATGSGGSAYTAGTLVQVYGATAPAYNSVDIDVRVNLDQLGVGKKTYLQFNVSNLFDTLYVGGFGGSSNRFSVPFVQIGAPRSVTAALVVGI